MYKGFYMTLLKMSVPIVSAFLGINLEEIKEILNKENLEETGNIKISESLDNVSKNLVDSKETIESALLEIEKQKKIFEQMKMEAETSQQISSMTQEQVNALNTLLESTLDKQDKKSFPKAFLWNLFFCVLSAILGFFLGNGFNFLKI